MITTLLLAGRGAPMASQRICSTANGLQKEALPLPAPPGRHSEHRARPVVSDELGQQLPLSVEVHLIGLDDLYGNL